MVDLRPRAEVVQEHSVHFWREVVLRDWIILWNGEKTVKERYSTFICSLQTDHSLFGCFWFPSCYLEEPRFCRIINSPELQSSLKSTSLKNTYKLIYQLPWGTVIPSLSTCEGGGRDISPSNPLTHSRNRCVKSWWSLWAHPQRCWAHVFEWAEQRMRMSLIFPNLSHK